MPAENAGDMMPEQGKKQKTDAEAADGTDKSQKPDNVWAHMRSIIFWLGLIVVMKVFVADIYSIPTGSMEPTLHGRVPGGDRIFCTKINYLWRNPERWEIFVFKFPHMQTPQGESSIYRGENFIKRCVGLPNEELTLLRGDVYASIGGQSPRLLVKPPHVQAGIWIPVYNENFADISLEELAHFWRAEGWEVVQGRLRSTGGRSLLTFRPHDRFRELKGVPDRYFRKQFLEFRCPDAGCGGRLRASFDNPKIVARCPACGRYLREENVVLYEYRTSYPSILQASFHGAAELKDSTLRGSDWHSVPDLRTELRVWMGQGARLDLQLFDDLHLCALRAQAGTEQALRLFVDGAELEAESLRGLTLASGEWHDLAFARVDGQLRVEIGGRLVADVKAYDDGIPAAGAPKFANIDILAEGEIEIAEIDIKRDVYYFQPFGAPPFRTGADGYMGLGDNQPESNDSRDWGIVPQKNLIGTAQFTWWPPQAARLLNLRWW